MRCDCDTSHELSEGVANPCSVSLCHSQLKWRMTLGSSPWSASWPTAGAGTSKLGIRLFTLPLGPPYFDKGANPSTRQTTSPSFQQNNHSRENTEGNFKYITSLCVYIPPSTRLIIGYQKLLSRPTSQPSNTLPHLESIMYNSSRH